MVRTKALSYVAIAAATALTGLILLADDNSGNSTWPQWGQNPPHQGFVNALMGLLASTSRFTGTSSIRCTSKLIGKRDNCTLPAEGQFYFRGTVRGLTP